MLTTGLRSRVKRYLKSLLWLSRTLARRLREEIEAPGVWAGTKARGTGKISLHRPEPPS